MSKEMQKFLKEPQRREMPGMGTVSNNENRTIELSFSSDVVLERWPGIAEKLSHEPGAVDLSRLLAGAPLLFNHNTDEVIGVVESARIVDGKGRAVVRFGKSEDAEEVWQDVLDGIQRNVSVGYRILEMKLTEENANGVDVYTATKWQPTEISMCPVPADISVGVGRSLEDNAGSKPQANAGSQAGSEAPAVPVATRGETPRSPIQKSTTITMSDNNTTADAISAERTRAAALTDFGSKYELQAEAAEFIRSGKSVAEFKDLMVEKLEKRAASQIKTGQAGIGLSGKEARRFSLMTLIRAMADPNSASARESAAFEFEVCRAASEKSGSERQGIIVPYDVLAAGTRAENIISNLEDSTGYTGTGYKTVQTTLQSGSYFELLRNKAMLLNRAQMLTGLTGNVDIPYQTSATTAGFIHEDADAPLGDMNFDVIQLRKKTLASHTVITRDMLRQSSLSVEALVRADMARQMALALDLSGFYGDGDNDTPVGILETSGIGTADFDADQPSYEEIVAMETSIATENADVSSMVYFANAKFRGAMKTTLQFPDVNGSARIWEQGGTVNGYAVDITNQIADGDVFFGNFADLLVGMWGGIELIADPYSGSRKGQLQLTTFQDVDFAVRRAKSFVYGVKPVGP